MDFGQAKDLAINGKRIGRKGWNGKGMFVYYVKSASYPAMMDVIKGIFPNDMVPYNPYFAIKTAQGPVSTWVPSVNDCLATDWEVVE